MRVFRGSIVVTVLGLALGAWLGWEATGTVGGTLTTVFIVAVLSILEISLSFDNAVVNATVLKQMDPVWRHRFITWGIAIAVFGMRILFPLVIVAVLAEAAADVAVPGMVAPVVPGVAVLVVAPDAGT